MPAQTHELAFGAETVTKVYRSWDRGEPDREWAALVLLADRAPGLAPVPLERVEVDGRPGVVMSRLPGVPLGDAPLATETSAAAGDALRALHEVRPRDGWDSWPVRTHGPAELAAALATALAEETDLTPSREPRLVAEAIDAARDWLTGATYDGQGRRVLGAADGNLANLLWDGERCRVVDFEDAGTSTRAYELADVVEHVSFRLGGRGDPEALARVAGLEDDDRSTWLQGRRFFACFWLTMLRPGGAGFHRNPRGSAEDQAAHVLRLLGTP